MTPLGPCDRLLSEWGFGKDTDVMERAPMWTTWRYSDSYAFMERTRHGMPPAIICCACNGGIQGKESNEAIPETIEEIADSVYEAYLAGASMVHVHARNPQNISDPATDVETWYRLNKSIRERCPKIIINNTTGGGLNMTMEERLSCLEARPEIASLNLAPDMSKFRIKERGTSLLHPRPVIEYDDCIPFTYRQINRYAAEMKKRHVKPELECYHPGCMWVLQDLISQELVYPPYWVQTVMGYQTSSYPTVDNVVALLRELPTESIWLCSGIGPFQLPMTTLATIMGGHVRVGLEDNLYFRRGEKAKSNAQLVLRAKRIITELNRDVASPQEARTILGMDDVPTQYS
jgi:3-keto-5-aminohexanoate cleavage enzyme